MKKIDHLYGQDGQDITEATLCEKLTKGNRCFVIKIADEIMGFTWCNFDVFGHPTPMYEFKLKENEAYLFDAYILKA